MRKNRYRDYVEMEKEIQKMDRFSHFIYFLAGMFCGWLITLMGELLRLYNF